MGAYACLSEDVDCYTVAPIAVGANATVSQGVKLCTASHDISSPIMELTYAPITISGNALVAGWTVVLPGVTIREGAVVDAGSVVVKDVEPWVVVGGSPAHMMKNRMITDFWQREVHRMKGRNCENWHYYNTEVQ